jgi:Protein of unknown function (DUF4232)
MNPRSSFEDRLNDWIQDGPTDAPPQILDGVFASLPSTAQRRAAWRMPWSTSPMIGFGRALAGLVVAVALGSALFLVLRPAPGGIGAEASPSPSPTDVAIASPSPQAVVPVASPTVSAPPTPTVSAPPTPTLTPSPSPTPIGRCDPANLAARITLWEGAAGHRIAHVELTNAGSVRCTVRSMEKPQLVDGNGSVLIDGAAPASSKALTMAPGAVLKTLVQDSNYCGPAPVAPVSVAFVLTDGRRFVATPFSPRDATVPPCNGAGSAADIEMQPWAP